MSYTNDELERALRFRQACERAINEGEVTIPKEIAPAVVTLASKIVQEAAEVFMKDFLDEISVSVGADGQLYIADHWIDLRRIQSSTFLKCGGVLWKKDGPTLMRLAKKLIDVAGCSWYRPEAFIVVDWLIQPDRDDLVMPHGFIPHEDCNFVLKFMWDNED